MLISVIVPVYNEQEVLPEFHQRLSTVMHLLSADAEVIYINDGSTDQTLEVVSGLQSTDPSIVVIDLSRNFGKEAAMSAGIDLCRGDWVIFIDADLQDPPEVIPKLLAEAQKGWDVVYAKRARRMGESFFKKWTASCFYRTMKFFGRTRIPEDTGDFRVMNRKALKALRRFRESHRFMKGLFAWIGFRQTAVLYDRDPRFAGETKWNYWKLWNFALEGITSYTAAPLKLATYLGVMVSMSALLYALVVIVKALVFGDPVKGYPSLMAVLLFLGGVQLFFLGLIGEYLGRTYHESKQRPVYLVNNIQRASVSPAVVTGVAL